MSNLSLGPRRALRAGAAAFLGLAALAVGGCSREAAPTERRTPAITAAPPAPARPPAEVLTLPRKPGSVRFAAIGDSGRGDVPQYEVSAQMQAFRKVFSYGFVVMLGDNVYDGGTPEYYRARFELPYKHLLDEGVKFYATIGNHDYPNQPFYPPFNMGGERYYTFMPPWLVARLAGTGDEVRFFMIDTERVDRPQLEWIDREMGRSDSDWKIPIFHRPIYTSGRYARPARALRTALEPLFVKHGVKVAFSGHEHFYERTKPQQGITYFISGGAGSLRVGDAAPWPPWNSGKCAAVNRAINCRSVRPASCRAMSRRPVSEICVSGNVPPPYGNCRIVPGAPFRDARKRSGRHVSNRVSSRLI